MKSSLSFLFFLVLSGILLWPHSLSGKNPIHTEPDTIPLRIDSLIVNQPVFSGLSPTIIDHRQAEVLLFNLFETQRLEVIRPKDNSKDRIRSTVLAHALQITYGATKNRRINIGLDIQYLHLRTDNDENSSPWKVLGGDSETGRSFHTFSRLGPRIRVMPMTTLPELTLQSALLFPLANDATLESIPDISRIQWLTQVSFYQQFRPWFYLFGGVSGSIEFPRENINELTTYSLPVNLYAVGEVLRRKLFFFGSLNYIADYEKPRNSGFKRRDYRFTFGVGAQYYLSPRFLLNLEYQLPFDNEIASSQVEPISGSLYALNLGLRYVTGKPAK
jgi:hypothetical protein